MGGVKDNENFLLNCSAWGKLYKEEGGSSKVPSLSREDLMDLIRLAPVTGAEENIGWEDEESFYEEFFTTLHHSGIKLSVGDGCPDAKLLYGINAIKTIQNEKDKYCRAAVFFKPYSDENLVNRIAWAEPVANHIGIDIDAYNIVTMRNKVNLEKKSAFQIQSIMKKIDVPFVLKGVFTKEDIELVKEAKPDIVYISNHGGRVETRKGSTALTLKEAGPIIKDYCQEIWVDGGIRSKKDIELAHFYGASQVLLARPFIKNFCYTNQSGIDEILK
ncbi:MAG: alpha-hydroxy-acid oxidizing protein [Treponema sp.]|nr:alpha-hydroxy-acid oxidizing protein [Treponema sp.]MBR5933779.1 alpha-hydroxy-acid oxidizing protein [Treponema sp.]